MGAHGVSLELVENMENKMENMEMFSGSPTLKVSFFLQTLIFSDGSKNHNICAWSTWSCVSSGWENVKWLLLHSTYIVTQESDTTHVGAHPRHLDVLTANACIFINFWSSFTFTVVSEYLSTIMQPSPPSPPSPPPPPSFLPAGASWHAAAAGKGED